MHRGKAPGARLHPRRLNKLSLARTNINYSLVKGETDMNDKSMADSCLRDAVRYEVERSGEGVSHCHCNMCRRAAR